MLISDYNYMMNYFGGVVNLFKQGSLCECSIKPPRHKDTKSKRVQE